MSTTRRCVGATGIGVPLTPTPWAVGAAVLVLVAAVVVGGAKKIWAGGGGGMLGAAVKTILLEDIQRTQIIEEGKEVLTTSPRLVRSRRPRGSRVHAQVERFLPLFLLSVGLCNACRRRRNAAKFGIGCG